MNSTSKLAVSLVQMDVRLGRPDANHQRLIKLLSETPPEPGLILLPELWNSGYDLNRLQTLAAEAAAGRQVMAELARRYRSYLGGSLIEKADGKLYNTFYLFDPEGREQARYRKIHLFSLLEEDRYFAAGQSAVITQIGGLSVGLMICYDLRFPELARRLALAGADLLLICAQWPKPRTGHWRLLLKARALENQLFIAACNRFGSSAGLSFAGGSALIDPRGNELCRAPGRENICRGRIDRQEIEAFRGQLDCLADRRPDTYSAPCREAW